MLGAWEKRFWIVAAILSACGFVLYYRYYLQFRL